MSPVAVMGQIQRSHPEERQRQLPEDNREKNVGYLYQIIVVFSPKCCQMYLSLKALYKDKTVIDCTQFYVVHVTNE